MKLDVDAARQAMKEKLASKFVFISPHYDDAVGSCACLIDLLIREKYDVDIVTVFSQQYFGNKSELAQNIINFCGLEDGVIERKIENQRACLYLHVNDINLLFYDAIYRKDTYGGWLYNSFVELFDKVNEQDNMLLQMLLQKIQSKYIPHKTFLFFPSAKGGHVDHKIVNQVGFLLKNIGYNIAFYDEFSYNENYDYMSGLDRRKLFFSADELHIKINAAKFYKSQHCILFQNKTVEEYYINMNQLNDKWFELYYIFPGEEDLADMIPFESET